MADNTNTDGESTNSGAAARLRHAWGRILTGRDPHAEITYRVRKLVQRLDAVAEKTFLKTIGARGILEAGIELTGRLEAQIMGRGADPYLTLTLLENRIDELVEKAHAFRIKAG